MKIEQWKHIPDFTGYQASSLGRIRSIDRAYCDKNGKRISRKGKVLTPRLHTGGYLRVSLGGGNDSYIHRLILLTFKPESQKQDVNHLNFDRKDNRLCNLEWISRKDNLAYTETHGRNAKGRLERAKKIRGQNHYYSRFKDADIIAMRAIFERGTPKFEIAKMYKTSRSHVSLIILRKIWRHL